MVRIFYLCPISVCMGGAAQPSVSSGRFWHGDTSMTRPERESGFMNGPEKWSRLPSSYLFRTKTTTHTGDMP